MANASSSSSSHAPPAAQDPEAATQPQVAADDEEEQTLTLFIAPPVDKAPLVRLEHVSVGDTVLSLRQLIAEYPALAGYTCYRLEVRSSEQDKWCVCRLCVRECAQPTRQND